MTNLSQKQIEEIKNYWKDPIRVDWEVAFLVSHEMGLEGKIIDEQAINLWGGEQAQRELKRLLSSVDTYLEQYRDIIHHAVCIEFDYCKKRKEKQFEEESYTLAIRIADVLIMFGSGWPVPVTSISVYLVKHKVLDRWCKCS